MSTTPSPRKPNGNESMLRLHPRGPPPLRMNHATPPSAALAGYPHVSVPHRSRMSPRQVKLQRMDPSPSYTIQSPLRDQISTNFHHELFQFHQLLRDIIEAKHPDYLQQFDSQQSAVISRDRRILELLTSDRGDTVLKEFFVRWRQFLRSKNVVDDPHQDDEEDDGSVLWEVFETFFSNLPLVLSESEVGGAGSPKAFFRYVDSLKSLRDLLIALLFKRPARDTNDFTEDNSDEDNATGLQSSIGLGFGLNFNVWNDSSSLRSTRRSPSTNRSKDRVPFYLYCQQLESELESLRRRVPHRRPRSPGVVAGALGEVGILQDNTVMLLLDFWGLPHEERLAFFCQIASQANEHEASAILHIFLDNCTTQTFMQIWAALQQSPQFQKMIQEAKLQLEPATVDEKVASSTNTAENEKEKEALKVETTDEKPLGSRGPARKRGRRSTRFVDLSGITEAYDGNENDGDSSDENDDEFKENLGDTKHDKRRLQKFTIRERGRLSLSGPSERVDKENQSSRRTSFRRSDHSRRRLKTPVDRESTPLLELLHNDLTEVIKMENGPGVHVMDAVWQLLEALDGQGKHASKSGYHRHVPLPAPVAVIPVQPPQPDQQIITQNPRGSIRTPLSVEQQFLMKLDQLQSMLVALGDARVHTMSTETITGAYRRMPILAKLFAALADTSLGAAGVDTAGGGMTKVVSNYGTTQHLTSSWQAGPSNEKPFAPLPVKPEVYSTTAGDNVREDVEAMGVLLVKLSKFVRSLAPLVDNEDSAPSSVSASDDVLTIMDLASKLENAGALVEAPVVSPGGGKRRLSLAADRDVPILLAVQSLARSNNFDVVSQLISSAVKAKMARIRVAAAEAKTNDEGGDDSDDDDTAVAEGDEEAMRIVTNLRRASAKAAQLQESKYQMTVPMQGGESPNVSSEGDTGFVAAIRANKGDIPVNIKNAGALRGVKLFNVDILLRIVNQLYRDNYEGMVSTLQYGNRRMEFSEFIYDWHIRKYGLKTLAQRHLLKLIQSLRKHEKKVFQCHLCLRFMGIQNPLGFHEHKFVLGLLSRWSLGTFLGGSKHRIEIPKRQFKIRITFAISTVQEALRERFGVYARGMDALAERIRAKACPRDDEFILESDLLTLCVEEFESQRALLEKVLGAVYQAGDINGDGSLEFDEFASVVTHLSPTVDDRFLQKVFEAAHDFTKPHRISFARFLDVILLERVLSPAPLSAAATGIARAKNAAAAAAASSTGGPSLATSGSSQQPNSTAKAASQDDQEEAYQFELLRETWAHDREAVAQVLQTSITHAPTAKSLIFRVAFLDQLLDRRVDAKTAWLCHRQIMREISRYQHLDADQIAGLRRKELQFKTTVRAIQNVQRLSALFGVNPALPGTNEDEGLVDTPEAPSYTSVVQQSLDAQATGIPDVADVAALENELRETFLERADEGAIDDYMAALQHLRRVSIKRQSLQFDELTMPRIEESLPEGNETDTDDDDESKEDEAEYDHEEVGPSSPQSSQIN
ncbi:hypothetical protein L916_05506 [Phytophthora nicotianae]|uniref:EF-hand domain-containing protein n=1 Tax=Phytophthora nicotianae TaxID=4792 RepID=W2JCF6_PHYNI|nr:hypothetical protein L916_05506 [Phytophthora nicotianae]